MNEMKGYTVPNGYMGYVNGKSTGRVPAMTGKNRNTMYPGEKKNRASKTALPNLSFSRAVCLPFAIILCVTGLK